jgi:hypothetical protein
MLHVINAFTIFSLAAMTAWRISSAVGADAPRGTATV